MATAKAISLKVRPIQSVDLCFEVSGIIGEQNFNLAKLGTRVQAFDLAGFYANLLASKGDASRPGLLKFDSQAIHEAVTSGATGGPFLFALRAENLKAVMDKAINLRENSYYQKYVNKNAVIAQTLQVYQPSSAPPAIPVTKPDRLDALAAISQTQHDTLSAAYNADSRTGVVKVTTNDMTSDAASTGTSDGTSTGTTTGTGTSKSDQSSTGKAKTSGTTTPSSGPSSKSTGETDSTGTSSTTGSSTSNQTSTGTSKTNTTGDTKVTQKTQNTDYGYRHPSAENDSQYQRAQVSLADERFAQFIFSQNLPFLPVVFDNELESIDLDVKRLQVSYLNTILFAPINGIVTGLFRDLGDCVQAGQPVMRVENDDEVLIVGTLKFRGLLSVGSKVSITTSIFDSPTPVTIKGAVVAIRGHDSEDEEWDAIIRCPNLDASNNPIFPINYNFDFDDTTVDIS
jgi:hypothetical protein